ncbi:MAG TPA: hypothetical protein VJR89_15135 [Polyangiales bacterium]|nr:hypothetical protein [Polyangiales bacterium]
MRMRSTFGVALLLGCFGVVAAANPAFAAPKKKKKAEAAAPVEPEPVKEKSVDDMMSESATAKPKADSGSASESKADEEPVGEPDAWERPPKDEEKPKAVAAAKAEAPVGDGRTIEVGLTPGFGFKAGDADWSTSLNPFGIGAGIRGGYSLDTRWYIGAGFIYHLGESDTLNANTPGAPTTAVISVRQNYMLAFAEGGYNAWLGNVIVRPSMWLGMGFAVVDPYLNTGGVHTVTDFLFAPGLSIIDVLDGWYIGGDGRWVFITGDGAKAIDLFLLIGLRFK